MKVTKNDIKTMLVKTPFFMESCLKLTKNLDPRIFVYHRFCHAGNSDDNLMDSDSFEWQLKIITRYCNVLSLGEYLDLKVNRKKIPDRTVVITIDDGYMDFYEYAYPILKKYGITATFFVTVNFIEKKIWLWPDRIDYIVKNTAKNSLCFNFDGKKFDIASSDSALQFKSWREITDYCISITNFKKWELIHSLENYTGVKCPEEIPSEYQPVTWEQLKEMSDWGIEIGSHTMTHPILSKIDNAELVEEINTSKTVIESRLGRKVHSFCYPNSAPGDINDAVIQQVKKSGYFGGVFGTYPDSKDIFQIPRIGSERNKTNFLWKLSGVEFLKRIS